MEHNQERVHDQYTALPDDLPQSVRAVVDQTRSDGVAAPASGHDEQIAAMRWLVDYFTDPANGFVYTLDAPDGDGRNNLEVVGDFLERRSGYCSHYASALAVLGRALGVPTRMVLGYSASGVQAEADFTYEVTADQLHAWVEAYIDDVGWVPFDVTPASTDDVEADDTDTPAAPGRDDADALLSEGDADAADADNTTTDGDTPDTDGNAGDDSGQPPRSRPRMLMARRHLRPLWHGWPAHRCGAGGRGVVLPASVGARRPSAATAAHRIRNRRRRRTVDRRMAGDRGQCVGQRRAVGEIETDRDIARRITDRLESGASAGTETIEQVGRIAAQASAAAFGGTSEHAGNLAPIVESAVEAMRGGQRRAAVSPYPRPPVPRIPVPQTRMSPLSCRERGASAAGGGTRMGL